MIWTSSNKSNLRHKKVYIYIYLYFIHEPQITIHIYSNQYQIIVLRHQYT